MAPTSALPKPRSSRGARALRTELRLGDAYVISCIGHHGSWSGLPFLVEVFRLLHARDPHTALLLVGGGSEVEELRRRALPEGVRLLGPVPPEHVPPYFHLSDLGVVPFEQGPFTDHALPLKVLEYAAAHKLVVATPLAELKTLRLPHVLLAARTSEAWLEAVAQARGKTWEARWEGSFEAFAWPRIAARLATLIDQLTSTHVRRVA